METKLLAIFLEVARSGGFAAAARKLDQDPSSVSREFAALEDQLGARLFQRTTRRVSLTEAGTDFAARIEPALSELEEARDLIHTDNKMPRGRLELSASVAFGQQWVMPHVPAFLARYPEIDLTLSFTDRNVDLIAERVDLAIRLGPGVGGDVVTTKLMDTRYRVCASPAYLASHDRLSLPPDLASHRCLCFDLPEFRTRWLFRQGAQAAAEIAITPRLVVSGALALREAALLDLGPALLADWLVDDDVRAGRLVNVFPDHECTATSFDTAAWLLYPSRRFLPRKTRVLIDFLRSKTGDT